MLGYVRARENQSKLLGGGYLVHQPKERKGKSTALKGIGEKVCNFYLWQGRGTTRVLKKKREDCQYCDDEEKKKKKKKTVFSLRVCMRERERERQRRYWDQRDKTFCRTLCVLQQISLPQGKRERICHSRSSTERERER